MKTVLTRDFLALILSVAVVGLGSGATLPLTALALNAISYTVAHAAKATDIGRDRIYTAIEEDELPARWVGNRWIIRAVDLDEWIQTFPTERRAS